MIDLQPSPDGYVLHRLIGEWHESLTLQEQELVELGRLYLELRRAAIQDARQERLL